MQVTLRVWNDTGRPTDPPVHDATPGSQGLLAWAPACFQPPWGGRRSVPPLTYPPANGPAPSLPDKTCLAFPTAAIPSSGYHALPERAGC